MEELTVYLAGQIHDDWRDEFRQQAKQMNLPLTFLSPMENHDRSDNIGEEILGEQPNNIIKDEVASQMNNLRTQVMMEEADIVIAYFGEKYKQWNTAMDCGIAIGMDLPLILVRKAEMHHALKEISNRAQITVENAEQALKAVKYIFDKK